jgi:predicted transcriptional regulator
MTANTTVKYQVLKAVEEMPQNVTFEEVMERLYFLYKVNQGLQQVDAGNIVSHEEAKKQIKTWHKSTRQIKL